MSIVLHHHPYSRASNVVWMLEELGVPYELAWVDVMKGEHKSDAHRALNSMGKLPVLVDDGVAIAESSAIGVYLADRYALGRLAPALDDPARGPYLRWCFYSPSVIEPGCMAKGAGWEYRASAAGWGSYEEILTTLEGGVAPGPWLLGDRFTMADVIVGGTLRYMLSFKMIEPRPAFLAYVERISERPAAQRAQARNEQVAKEHGLGG